MPLMMQYAPGHIHRHAEPAIYRTASCTLVSRTRLRRVAASLVSPDYSANSGASHLRSTSVAVHSIASQQEPEEADGTASGHHASTSSAPLQRASVRSRRTDYELVEEPAQLIAMLEELRSVDCIALDCEGLKLGSKDGGKLSLMQISARLGSKASSQSAANGLKIWVVDVTKLQRRALNYHTKDRKVSLRKILEDSKVTKLMYDVRSDAAQLSTEYDVRMRGALDLQLAEVAVRQLQQIPTMFVLPLDRALENYVLRTPAFEADMVMSKQVSAMYHHTNHTEIWEQRPLSDELLKYASIDVKYLHQLQEALMKKLPQQIMLKVKNATASRVKSPFVAAEQRAAAPVIVKKHELRQLLQVRPSSSGSSNPSTIEDSSSSPGGDASTGMHASGTGEGSSANGAPESPVTARKPPQLLSLPSSSPQGKSAAESLSSFLLQPRQRLPDEPLPAWMMQAQSEPTPAAAPAAAEDGPAQAEVSQPHQEAGSDHTGCDGTQAGARGEASTGSSEHAGSAGATPGANSTESSAGPSFLLWKTEQPAATARTMPLNKPMRRPSR